MDMELPGDYRTLRQAAIEKGVNYEDVRISPPYPDTAGWEVAK